MKRIVLLLTVLMSISTMATSNFLGLSGKNCSIVEDNFEITGDDISGDNIELHFGNDSIISCGNSSFKIYDVLTVKSDAERLANITGDKAGLDLFGIRTYKLKQKFPSLKLVADEFYEVTYSNVRLTFFIENGRVDSIGSDWSKKYTYDDNQRRADDNQRRLDERRRAEAESMRFEIAKKMTSLFSEDIDHIGSKSVYSASLNSRSDKNCNLKFRFNIDPTRYGNDSYVDLTLNFRKGITWNKVTMFDQIEFLIKPERGVRYSHPNGQTVGIGSPDLSFKDFDSSSKGYAALRKHLDEMNKSCYKTNY
ncbi:hypothetical protein A9Q84_17030 [Halobacteriovorax marinus]|uniref:Lipoprotein n=1 Tax=Halobacteriovorax marinus TaxID=97084 RepID=A0A1Y5F3K6_9BACT|nr:hypothetical protein A9Q84_17030 [Halobacteriovorax marinus]